MLHRRRRNVLYCITLLASLYLLFQLLSMDTVRQQFDGAVEYVKNIAKNKVPKYRSGTFDAHNNIQHHPTSRLGEKENAMPLVALKDERANSYQGNNQVITLEDMNLTAGDGDWQPVTGSSSKFFVYSAFYEARKEPDRSVRIVAACLTKPKPAKRESYWCLMWYGEDAQEPQAQQAAVKVIRENANLKYSACFVSCPLINSSVPMTVSVVRNIYDVPTNHLRVINNVDTREPQQQLSVCVKPIHYDYNRTVELLEFFELYKILGASHFTVYRHTASPAIDCILQSYAETGEVTVMPWQVDLRSKVDVRTENMFAALNDCLYRNMYRYANVALVDFDEYIIPKHNETLVQLLDYLDRKKYKQKAGSYVFKNAFYYREWSDDLSLTENNPLLSKLLTLTKTRMKTKLLPYRQRSKYTCKPELVVEVGNHFVWQHIKGVGSVNVEDKVATSQHYRNCESGTNKCTNTSSAVDKRAHRYSLRLKDSVMRKWDELKDICQFPSL